MVPFLLFSKDGNFLAIGASGDWGAADSLGCVKVHSMDKEDGTDSSWKELGQTLRVMSNGDNFWFSISLSNNGNSLAIGAVGGNYAQVYSIDEGDEPNMIKLNPNKILVTKLTASHKCPVDLRRNRKWSDSYQMVKEDESALPIRGRA